VPARRLPFSNHNLDLILRSRASCAASRRMAASACRPSFETREDALLRMRSVKVDKP
jgi:hypothetical protein